MQRSDVVIKPSRSPVCQAGRVASLPLPAILQRDRLSGSRDPFLMRSAGGITRFQSLLELLLISATANVITVPNPSQQQSWDCHRLAVTVVTS